MKKKIVVVIGCFCLCACFLFLLGIRFPGGKAAYIRTSAGYYFYNCKFQYVNENTVRIKEKDGSIYYFDSSQITCIEKE